jgi:transcriptional regulator with XRE-family HTH domain
MDPVRFGRQVRALRRRRGWRQVDLALSARTSRATVSRVELGRADELTVRALDAIARALAARLDVNLNWNGEGLDRLLDVDHAALVEEVARTLRALNWLVKVEVSFNVRGERGSIDILAFHPDARVVLVVEVKSVVPDIQATLFVLDRKSRLALAIAREQGWVGRSVGRLLVVRATRTSRRRIDAHPEVFRSAFPYRSAAVKRWLRQPDNTRAFAGLWFVTDDRPVSARHRVRSGSTAVRA